MADRTNYLLGQGERLTSQVQRYAGGGDKNPAYDFDTARNRIGADVAATVGAFAELPQLACPNGEAVAAITLHPRYLSKSDYPAQVLEEVGLRALGSKTVMVRPESWGIQKHPIEAPSTLLYVAGPKDAFEAWAGAIPRWVESAVHRQIVQFETVDPVTAEDRMRAIPEAGAEILLELVVHTDPRGIIIEHLEAYAETAGVSLDLDRLRTVGGLSFMPATASRESIRRLAQFSFLRVVRGMPRLRPLTTPVIRMTGAATGIELPDDPPEDPESRVAVFDGGIPNGVHLPWVQEFDTNGVGPKVPDLTEHGLMVTSAVLFGHLHPRQPPRRPYAGVDHYRVLGDDAGSRDGYDLYEVLGRIVEVLEDPGRPYHFVNLSLGPQMAVEDDDVTLWTSQLDAVLSQRDALVTVAVGNDGHLDATAGLNRIQPPSDGVNVLGVGACAYFGDDWEVADYSCVGPGRRPGVVKPDVVGFGGSAAEPFLGLINNKDLGGTMGTSFAAPSVLRTAAGVRAALGPALGPLAIRTLLIHHADPGDISPVKAGWGRVPEDVAELLTSDDDTFHVVYQGEVPFGQLLRAEIPYPEDSYGTGMVYISATLCISSSVDPDHADAYTRSGLEVAFRPDVNDYRHYPNGNVSHYPKTAAFFSQGQMYPGEYVLREDGHKWESVLKATQRKRASGLNAPCFDIFRHEREYGAPPTEETLLKYALVVTVRAPRTANLYDRIRRTYNNVLVPLEPRINLRVRS